MLICRVKHFVVAEIRKELVYYRNCHNLTDKSICGGLLFLCLNAMPRSGSLRTWIKVNLQGWLFQANMIRGGMKY
jgi:hypothetical protein